VDVRTPPQGPCHFRRNLRLRQIIYYGAGAVAFPLMQAASSTPSPMLRSLLEVYFTVFCDKSHLVFDCPVILQLWVQFSGLFTQIFSPV